MSFLPYSPAEDATIMAIRLGDGLAFFGPRPEKGETFVERRDRIKRNIGWLLRCTGLAKVHPSFVSEAAKVLRRG